MIPVYLCKNNDPVIHFTTDDMGSNFEACSNNKINALYLNKIMITEWIQIIYELWYEGDTNLLMWFLFMEILVVSILQ